MEPKPSEACLGPANRSSLGKRTFLIIGVISLLITISGFAAAFFNQLLSILLIAAGGISFWFVLRKAKKEAWFGKPTK